MTDFWHTLPQPFFVLAPMEAVTDVVFRHVIAEAAPPDIWFSEFTNATGWVHAGEKATGGRLFKTDDEQPIVAQIWGGEPGDMEQLALHCRSLGYSGIDINMGCPAKSAVKSGGSALIRNPELAAQSIAAAKTAKLPVSVKTRLGYTRVDEWREWLTHLLKQDIVNLTIHLRTKKEMSKVPAHHELIDDIIELRDAIAPRTKLTINGDVRDRAHGLQLIHDHPGINGIMIGRGVFHDPYCFAAISSEMDDSVTKQRQLLDLLRIHLDYYDTWQQITHRPYETLKRFFKIYIRDFQHASELRALLMDSRSTHDARQLLDTYQAEQLQS